MLDTIALWIGYFIMIMCMLFFGAFLLWLTYMFYDAALKKILGWKHLQTREDIFYFIKHKKEIQNYIKNKKGAVQEKKNM